MDVIDSILNLPHYLCYCDFLFKFLCSLSHLSIAILVVNTIESNIKQQQNLFISMLRNIIVLNNNPKKKQNRAQEQQR